MITDFLVVTGVVIGMAILMRSLVIILLS
jgi:hypothetical protein